jgi:hypothetical protein
MGTEPRLLGCRARSLVGISIEPSWLIYKSQNTLKAQKKRVTEREDPAVAMYVLRHCQLNWKNLHVRTFDRPDVSEYGGHKEQEFIAR